MNKPRSWVWLFIFIKKNLLLLVTVILQGITDSYQINV